MGLDGTIEQVDIRRVIDNFHFDDKPSTDETDKGVKEIMYWRKNYKLQDFMRNLYYEKGGEEEFNHVYIRLDEDDLDTIDHYAINGKLNLDEGRMDEGRDFITNARIAINSGYAIYYYSSW